jgi:hypothetical protein
MTFRLALVAFILASFVPSAARAQDAKSGDLAKQLAQLLDQKKLDAVAAPDGENAGGYVAALYFPGTQLIVVSARYAELASASILESKLFVMDTYANGLSFKPSGSNAPDSVDHGSAHTVFDGEWKKAKMSEADYMKVITESDAAYVRALQGLINKLKASGT